MPLLHSMIRLHSELSVMQDNALHFATRTMEEFEERSITPIKWLLYSPNVYDIKHVGKMTKEKIKDKDLSFGDKRRRSTHQIRGMVNIHCEAGVGFGEYPKTHKSYQKDA